ncbi:MAG: hypothetical protein M5U28_04080 [Sandaracinaceae bacterium]|nr:hypothetical protein [Sandaracinaceae bacterium]
MLEVLHLALELLDLAPEPVVDALDLGQLRLQGAVTRQPLLVEDAEGTLTMDTINRPKGSIHATARPTRDIGESFGGGDRRVQKTCPRVF